MCNIISIVLAWILMILSNYSFSQVSRLRNPVLDIRENWETRPIVKILTTNKTAWPAGYENLIESREWPGTVWGCNWEYSSTINAGLIDQVWNDFQYEHGWLMVPPKAPVPLNKINSKLIWGLRSYNAFKDTQRPDLSINNTLIWPKDFKLWGKGNINAAYWTKDYQLCPINDLFIYTLPPGSNSSTLIDSEYTYLSLGNNTYLVFTRNATSLPITKIKITEGDVWINPKQYMKTPDRELYKLLVQSNYGEWNQVFKNKTTDDRYTLFGSTDEHSLFKDCGVYNFTKTLPHYDLVANPTWNFYFSRYYEWDTQWEKDHGVNREELISIINTCDGVTRFQKIVGLITKINLVFCVLWLLASLAILHWDKLIHNILHIFLMANAWILILICLIFVFIWLIRPYMWKQQFSRVENANCSDELTNKILIDFIEKNK